MNRIKTHRFVASAGVAAIVATACFQTTSVNAREPFTPAELAQQSADLQKMVKMGDDLWHNGKLGTNGLACGNCHPDGAASNAQTYPKWQSQLGEVVPLRDMINWCIEVPLAGKKLDVNSKEMKAMEAYAYYMHRGFKLAPGDATQQYPSVVVKSGPGYP
jgi:thiosulfate dehydrogenase